MQQQWTISQLDCDVQWKVDFIRQPSITSSVVGQRRRSKALLKGKLAPKKDHGHYLGICCGQSLVVSLIHYSFLNLGETITSEKYAQQINEIHWKLQHLQLALSNRILLHNNIQLQMHNQHFKSWTNWTTKFCLITIFTWPLANRLPLLQASQQLLAGKMLPQPAGARKCLPRVHWNPKHGFLCYRNKQTYFSLEKMCWL